MAYFLFSKTNPKHFNFISSRSFREKAMRANRANDCCQQQHQQLLEHFFSPQLKNFSEHSFSNFASFRVATKWKFFSWSPSPDFWTLVRSSSVSLSSAKMRPGTIAVKLYCCRRPKAKDLWITWVVVVLVVNEEICRLTAIFQPALSRVQSGAFPQ